MEAKDNKLKGLLGVLLASVLVLTFVVHTFETTHTHSPFEGAHEDVFSYLQYFHSATEELLFILLFALFSLVWGMQPFVLSYPRPLCFFRINRYRVRQQYSYFKELYRRGLLKNMLYG